MSANMLRQLSLLPEYLGWHILLTVIAIGIGLIISVPLGLVITRQKVLGGPILTLASVVQTVPSMAMLALVFLVLAFVSNLLPEALSFRALGFWPAMIALTLYSILPMLRNTVVGISGVDPSVVEAARGLGMTDAQVLRKVELPLALPVLVAGIRTAAVWTVGIATLSTPIGQTSLGNYIFGGLQTSNFLAIAFGCIGAAVLAIILDGLIAGLEWASSNHSRPVAVVIGLVLAGVVCVGLAGQSGMLQIQGGATIVDNGDDAPADLTPVRIGAKTFNEQFILAELIARRMNQTGLEASKTESLGSIAVYNALANDEIDVYIDYSGTIWFNAMGRSKTPSRESVLYEMTSWLGKEPGITCLGPLGFENTYALAMRRERAEELGIETIDDLVDHAGELSIGSDIEFFERPEWQKLQATYDIHFAERVPMDPALMYQAAAKDEVDVITAFSSDGRIAAYDLKVLADPRGAFPPYDAVLLLSHSAARRPALVKALRPLVGAIDVQLMRQANQMVDIDGQPPASAAASLDATLRGDGAEGGE